MALDNASQIAQIIGGVQRTQGSLTENLSPDENASTDTIASAEAIVLTGTVTVNAHTLSTSGLIYDHLLYGEIDHTYFYLDEPYADGGSGAFSLSFPVVFGEYTAGSTVFSGFI